MLKGTFGHRMTVCCPVCRQEDYEVKRRTPGIEGRVSNRCECKRCSATFEYQEDREGRPLKK